MLVDRGEVLKLLRAYLLLEAGPYDYSGFERIRPVLRVLAAEALTLCFEFEVHPDDVRVSVVSVEGEPGQYRFVYRATWEPNPLLVSLAGGPQNGQEYTQPYPASTVTIRHGVGAYEQSRPSVYRLAGFDAGARRFIFKYQEKPPDVAIV